MRNAEPFSVPVQRVSEHHRGPALVAAVGCLAWRAFQCFIHWENKVPPLIVTLCDSHIAKVDSAQNLPFFYFFHLGEFGSYVLSSHFSQGSALVRWNLDWGRAESALFFGAHAFCRCIFFTLAATFGPTPQANFLGCSTKTENCGHIDRRVLLHPTSTTKHQLRDASASER